VTSDEAFTGFVADAEPRLRRAFTLLRGGDVGADATAEALAWAWEHWAEVQAMGNPVGYLYRVGSSKTRYREERFPHAVPPPDAPGFEPRLVPALARLTLRQRTAVVLVHGCGWTHQEVADALADDELAPAVETLAPRRRRWLAAAAAVFLVALVGPGLAGRASDDGEHLRAGESVTTTMPSTEPVDVSFQQLGASNDSAAAGALAAAQNDEELRQLRIDAGVSDRSEVDFSTHVVVAFTVVGRDCPATFSVDPPMLGGMVRTGTDLEPQFLIPDACDANDTPRTFVVAVPWAETGDEFDLVLSGNLGGEAGRQLHVTREHHEPAPPSKVTASLQLDATTVPVGGTITGTVTVVNDSGAPIEGTTCGDYFVGSLSNEEYQQGVARALCLRDFTIPEGTSTYPISVVAAVNGCTLAEVEDQSLGPRCNPDGSMPALPSGEYQLRIDDAQQLVPAIDPVTVTVT